MDFSSSRLKKYYPQLLLALIFLIGIALRLFFVAEQSPLLIEQHPPGSDMLRYYNWAQKIYQGQSTSGVFQTPPFYPYLLGGIFKISGGSLKMVLALQMILGLFSAYLLYLIAKDCFSRPVALIALFLYLTYSQFILYEQVMLTDSLGVFLTILFLWFVLEFYKKPNYWRALLGGGLLGLAALNRPTILGFLPLLFLWVIFIFREPRMKRLTYGLLLAGGAFLVILPATIHNYRQTGEFVLISYIGGVNFYLGNGEGAQGWFHYPPRYKELQAQIDQENLSPAQQSRRWYQETFSYIKSHPGNFISLVWRKFNLFWGRWEIPQNLNYSYLQARYPFFRVPLPTFGIIAPLGLLGMIILWRSSPNPYHGLMMLFVAFYSGAIIIFLVVGRYRFPVVPLLILFAAYALGDLTEKSLRGEFRKLIWYMVLGIILWLFINYKPLYFTLGV